MIYAALHAPALRAGGTLSGLAASAATSDQAVAVLAPLPPNASLHAGPNTRTPWLAPVSSSRKPLDRPFHSPSHPLSFSPALQWRLSPRRRRALLLCTHWLSGTVPVARCPFPSAAASFTDCPCSSQQRIPVTCRPCLRHYVANVPAQRRVVASGSIWRGLGCMRGRLVPRLRQVTSTVQRIAATLAPLMVTGSVRAARRCPPPPPARCHSR